MANLLDLRNKISSTKNTGQITKALEMVSAARQKKAQDFLNNSRYLRIGINELMGEVQKTRSSEPDYSKQLPWFFRKHHAEKILFVTIMSQRGLCGSMNSNLFFEILKFKKILNKKVEFVTVNKMAQKYLKNFEEPVVSYFSNIKENPDIDYVLPISDFVKSSFSEYESVYLAYTSFIKSGVFVPKIIRLLPIERSKPELEGEESAHVDYSIEPDPYSLLRSLANLYVDFEIYEAVLSNQASEHSARMIAMKKATDNVKEIVKNLTLTMNKERQAKITQAVSEISANL